MYTYKIENTLNTQFPFQLFKQASEKDGQVEWMNLSIYASIRDCVVTFLKELYSTELEDEIYHGQAFVSPADILKKIEEGKPIVSIYDDTTRESLLIEFDISFKNLIQRQKLYLKK